MRGALIVSLLLAIAAAVFAIQNPNETSVNVGPYEIVASTALVIIVTFVLGVTVGSLASLPARMRQRKQLRQFKRGTAAESKPATDADVDPLASRPHGSTEY